MKAQRLAYGVIGVLAVQTLACGGPTQSELKLTITADSAGTKVVHDTWAFTTLGLEAHNLWWSRDIDGREFLHSAIWQSSKEYVQDNKTYKVIFSMQSPPVLSVGKGLWKPTLGSISDTLPMYSADGVNVFIDRIRVIDNRTSPLEVTGTISSDPTAATQVTGSFKMYSDCQSYNKGPFLCGLNTWAKLGIEAGGAFAKPQTGSFELSSAGGDCPAELLQPFVDGKDWKYDVTSFQVGTATALKCVEAGQSDASKEGLGHLCSATKENVQADGCTWTVDAISNPAETMYVFGVAGANCTRAAGRYCNAVYQ